MAEMTDGSHGATIFGCSGPVLLAEEAALFREADPWGFILFGRNVESPAQLSALTAALRASVGRDAPVLIDQEGGRVQRLTPPHWAQHLPALDQAEAAGPDNLERSFYLRFRLIAAELHAVGIDVDCAPLLDVAGPQTHPFLKNRCYGTDSASVFVAARAAAEGLMDGGVLPVVKHMPGHGRASVDSHHSLPRVTAGLDVLEAIGSIDVPVTIINGRRDEFRIHERRFLAANDAARLVVLDDAGHISNLNRPKRFTKELRAAFERAERPPLVVAYPTIPSPAVPELGRRRADHFVCGRPFTVMQRSSRDQSLSAPGPRNFSKPLGSFMLE